MKYKIKINYETEIEAGIEEEAYEKFFDNIEYEQSLEVWLTEHLEIEEIKKEGKNANKN